jgi:hypothetical protein
MTTPQKMWTAPRVALSVILVCSVSHGALAQDATTRVDTGDAVENAPWADNVTITINDEANNFTFDSDGVPSHGYAEQYLNPKGTPGTPVAEYTIDQFDLVESAVFFTESPINTEITTLPVYSEIATDTALGRIGVTLSGAQLFNDYENQERSIVAMDDNFIHDHAAFLDECNGHALNDGASYHYHGIPVCLTVDLDVEGEHSYMLGVLGDGFPVYANQDINGEIIGDDELDDCSGHFGATPEFTDGIYHYHLTADEAPYSIDCYHGEIEIETNTGPGGGGGGPDFTDAAEALGISVDTLRDALGAGGPPDFEAAAETLAISVDDLTAVMPAPPE